MPIIRYSSGDLRDRANQLRELQGRYDAILKELNDIMFDLQEVYTIDGKEVIENEMNLSFTIKEISSKLYKLASLINERADQIDYESENSIR